MLFKIKNKKMTLNDPKNTDQLRTTLKKILRDEEETVAKRLADELRLPYLNLYLVPVDPEAVVTIPKEESLKGQVAVIEKAGHKIRVAAKNPASIIAKNILENLKEKGFELHIFVVSLSSLAKAWEVYNNIKPTKEIPAGQFRLEQKVLDEFEKEIKNIHALKSRIGELSPSEVLGIILAGAIKTHTSDIHLEPDRKNVRLRYRIDGLLQDVSDFSKEGYHYILSKIKALSDMRINVSDEPQDGRFTVVMDTGAIDMRVSILPSGEGETVVMRLLSSNIQKITIEDLGLDAFILDKINQELEKTNGMILTTGPTGSGKTTTLYAMLNMLNQPGVKVITIEDPIEYKLTGILQTQVNQEKGYTFAQALRALLRQNPNIVMVGEIRDEETAKIALQASLTGHLLLSTLHANDAVSTFARLEGLGMKRDDIAASANVIIAQRLARKLCEKCKVKYVPSKTVKDIIKKELGLSTPKKINLYKPKGCKTCDQNGYHGITGLYEIIIVNPAIREAILKEENIDAIRSVAVKNGMLTLLRDGVEKSLEGITSWEEVKRVVG